MIWMNAHEVRTVHAGERDVGGPREAVHVLDDREFAGDRRQAGDRRHDDQQRMTS